MLGCQHLVCVDHLHATVFCFQMVNLLLNRGVNFSAIDKKDRQALHWAAYMGELDPES